MKLLTVKFLEEQRSWVIDWVDKAENQMTRSLNLDWDALDANTEDEGIRTMTPLESQWMDFKKVLSELVVFQEVYEKRSGNICPGNKYYANKLMKIVNNAKSALNVDAFETNEAYRKYLESMTEAEYKEKVEGSFEPQHQCPECGAEMEFWNVKPMNVRRQYWQCPNCGREE